MPFSGVPEQLVTDRGPQFCNIFLTELVRCIGIKHKLPSPYHPQSNGVLERWHRDLNAHLRLAVASVCDNAQWLDGVGTAVYAHNSSYHSALGTSPYQLCFGIEPPSPVDQWHLHTLPHGTPKSNSAMERIDAIRQAKKLAVDALKKAQQTMNKRLSVTRDRAKKEVAVGDWVLVDSSRFQTKLPKLQPRVLGPFEVIGKHGAGQLELAIGSDSRLTPLVNLGDCCLYEHTRDPYTQTVFEQLLRPQDRNLRPFFPVGEAYGKMVQHQRFFVHSPSYPRPICVVQITGVRKGNKDHQQIFTCTEELEADDGTVSVEEGTELSWKDLILLVPLGDRAVIHTVLWKWMEKSRNQKLLPTASWCVQHKCSDAVAWLLREAMTSEQSAKH